MSPNNSPQSAPAATECYGKDPKFFPLSLRHIKKASEQRSGYSFFIYDPSFTAKELLSCIASSIQLSSPTIRRDSHNQVLSHSINTSRNQVGISCERGGVAVEVTATTSSANSRTEQMFSLI